MKTNQVLFLLMVLMMGSIRSLAQNPVYFCDLRNHSFVSSQVYEFDVYLTRGGTVPLELANYQAAIQVNPLLIAGGSVTPSIVIGSSELNSSQQPSHIAFDAATGTIKIAPQAPPRTLGSGGSSTTDGTIVPDGNGVKVCRVQLSSDLPLGQVALNPVWNFDVDPYNTVVSAFTGSETAKVNTIITNTNNHGRTLQLTAFLEGPYNQDSDEMLNAIQTFIPSGQPYSAATWSYPGTETVTTIPDGVVDWVLVELRDASQPDLATSATTRLTRALFVNQDGTITSLDGFSTPEINFTPESNLYAVVKHRNHLAVISANALSLSGSNYQYDFSTSIDQALGGTSGYKQIDASPARFGLVAADIDADGSIFTSDFNSWAGMFGNTDLYNSADADLDGSVFTSDFNKWAGNFGIDNPVDGPGKSLRVPLTSQVP